MEFPRDAALTERRAAACVLLLTLATAVLENRSPLATAIRHGHPWTCWAVLEGYETPARHDYLVVYWPTRPALDLVYLPAGREEDSGPDEEAAPAGVLRATGKISADPALSLKDRLGPAIRAADLPWFDRFRLGVERRRLASDEIRPAWLPARAERPEFWTRRLQAAPSEARPLTVEVLNASGRKGVASQVAKVLRSKGADVTQVGNVAAGASTVIYDRAGSFENASAVRRMLGCPSAEAATRVDNSRLVDVSVILGDDCDQ